MGSGIQKLIGGDTQTPQTAWRSHKHTFYFFKIRKESEKKRRDVLDVTAENCNWKNREDYLWCLILSVETFRTIRKNIP
jgi:hypothetical protein